ncbi:dihydroxy-acid dehydratase [Apiospora arundinis]
MPCDTPCGSCAAPCRDGIDDIEDYLKELDLLQKQKAHVEAKISGLRGKDVPASSGKADQPQLRSALWYNHPDQGQKALYVERPLNFGWTIDEIQSKPKIGIAQTGSDLTPCNRHHVELVKRVRDGIRDAGGLPVEFPALPIQESLRRPSAMLDRNLLYISMVEALHGNPFDAVVLLTGCDKTTPGLLMAAATVNIPAICLNVGPMLNGWMGDQRIGSGSVVWKARELHASGQIDGDQVIEMVAKGTPSPGHCNTMGTASTMNALAEALGMALSGSAAIPAVYRERPQMAYATGKRIVEMVHENLCPSDILTREAFENAIVANTAIGGSSNAPIHLIAIAKQIGMPLDMSDWDKHGYEIPLLLNMQPAGKMLSEDYYRAGGLPAILAELLEAGLLPHPDIKTVDGHSVRRNIAGEKTTDPRTIRPVRDPLKQNAGFVHLSGTLFESAIMKTSVISPEFRREFLSDPADPDAFECPVAVFDGPEDYHARLEQAPIGPRTILVMRGVGPLGYPGAAEVVNMHAPAHLLKQGIAHGLPCIGDGRQSGTSASPSILNASPEAADGGNLALLRDGDVGRRARVGGEELQKRGEELRDAGGYEVKPSQTPWQELYRREVGRLDEGAVLKFAPKYQRVAQKYPAPRDNH